MAKRITFYGMLTAVCIVLGYVEHLISFDFIAPGIKIGLANCVGVWLMAHGKVGGAYAVNITRILLSVILFSNPSALIYSLSGGVVSLSVMWVFSKFKCFGIIGFSVAGAVIHNLTQLICAALLLGRGVWYYLPFLLLAAVVSGIATGTAANLILKKIKF